MDRSVQQRRGECSLNPLLRSKSKNQDPPGYDIFYEARPKAPLPNLTGGIIGDDLFSARICPAPEITAQPPSEEQITQLIIDGGYDSAPRNGRGFSYTRGKGSDA